MNTSQIINLHFCTTLSQNAQSQYLILSFSGRVTWAALDNPKIRAADEFPSKGREGLLQAVTGIRAEVLLMTMQKLGWQVKGKRRNPAIRALFRGLRQPSRDRREQCREWQRASAARERRAREDKIN